MSEPPFNSGSAPEPLEELIRRAQQRNARGQGTPQSHEAFTHIYQHYINDLSHYLLRVMRNKEEAEEIIQRTFVTLWISLPGWKSVKGAKSLLRGFIFTIAEREALQYWRNKARPAKHLEPLQEQNDLPSWLFGTKLESEATVEEQECIRQVLETLSSEERKVLLLHHEGGCKAKEIVQILKIMGIKALTQEQAERRVRGILARAEEKFVKAYDERCRS